MLWIRKKIGLLKNMKVKEQLIGIYVLVVLIPILIVGVYMTRTMCNMVVERAINEASVNIDRIKERLNEVIKIANSVADRIYIDEQIKTILMTNFGTYGEVVETYNRMDTIDNYLKNYSEIVNVRIYTDNQTLLNNSQFMSATAQIKKEQWYKDAVDRNGKIEWLYKYDETTRRHYLSLVRAIRDTHSGHLGVLVIDINPDKLQRIIKDEPYDTIIAVNQEIITKKGKSELIESKLGDLRAESQSSKENYKLQIKGEEGINYIIFNAFSPTKAKDTTIEICMNMSVQSVTSETIRIIQKSMIIIGITTILSGLLIVIFIHRFASRIILVRKEMHKVVSGDFNIRPSIEGKDEIGELYTDIYATVESVKSLVQEVYIAKVQKEELKRRQKEMQFEMLASQINPHFLYNTLETIRMKAYCTGQVELANVVKMLSKLLRRNLEVTDRVVTVQSELNLIKAYLEIQKFRFGERISYEITSKIDTERFNILPLILQPIVENAFVHGLEGKSGPGKIKCSISEEEAGLVIIIEDDGLGITKERLKKLQENLSEGKETIKGSVGLNNINQRLKLYYGDAYGIGISSEIGKGSKVIVHLPKT